MVTLVCLLTTLVGIIVGAALDDGPCFCPGCRRIARVAEARAAAGAAQARYDVGQGPYR